ncbi:MAG TPA: hypothetical protein VNO31_02905 [Umezawaea sp.]|nr:hypothetical protein [Umezawaea sp.]
MLLAEAAVVADSVKGGPWVVYGSMVVLFLGYLATVSETLQKLLGPLGKWLAARQARRAERAASRTDVRIADLQGQVKHLAPRLDLVESELYELQSLVADHARWDWQVLDAVRKFDPDFPSPPPLRPNKT